MLSACGSGRPGMHSGPFLRYHDGIGGIVWQVLHRSRPDQVCGIGREAVSNAGNILCRGIFDSADRVGEIQLGIAEIDYDRSGHSSFGAHARTALTFPCLGRHPATAQGVSRDASQSENQRKKNQPYQSQFDTRSKMAACALTIMVAGGSACGVLEMGKGLGCA